MAKKTKDLEKSEINTTNQAKSVTKKATDKKSSTKRDVAKKSTSTKKEILAKKDIAKKSTVAKKTATTKKTATAKKSTATSSKEPVAKKTSATKKQATTTSKAPVAKKSTRSKKSTGKKAVTFSSEYYDLPYSYNKTVVKILAQTPTTLFVYWELSEQDCNKLRKKYGDNFFNVTKPILIVFNDTLNYSFEIEINDFANSWYIHTKDANCDYHIELGRKPLLSANKLDNTNQSSEYIPYYVYLTSSNEMSTPNDKILFNLRTITFRNIKTGKVTQRSISEFKFITNVGIFSFKDLYKKLFPNENFEFENFLSGSHSSGNPSSGSFTSSFR